MAEITLGDLDWKYNIPRCFTYDIQKEGGCRICDNEVLFEILPPYLFSVAPIKDVTEAINNDFGFDYTETEMAEHKKHIKRNMIFDDVKDIGKVNKAITDRDVVAKCDVNKALQSSLNSLYAQKLEMERVKDFSKEYFLLINQLKGFIELQSKIDGKIKENEIKICLKDLIQLKDATHESN